jgi:hypothetical protein
VLDLADTAVASIAPIAGLPKLATLHLDGTRVTDLSPGQGQAPNHSTG